MDTKKIRGVINQAISDCGELDTLTYALHHACPVATSSPETPTTCRGQRPRTNPQNVDRADSTTKGRIEALIPATLWGHSRRTQVCGSTQRLSARWLP